MMHIYLTKLISIRCKKRVKNNNAYKTIAKFSQIILNFKAIFPFLYLFRFSIKYQFLYKISVKKLTIVMIKAIIIVSLLISILLKNFIIIKAKKEQQAMILKTHIIFSKVIFIVISPLKIYKVF